jgi:hypothetical protein
MNCLLYYYVAILYSFISLPSSLEGKTGAMMLLLGAERQMSRLFSLQLSIYYIASRSCRTCDGLFVVPKPPLPPRTITLWTRVILFVPPLLGCCSPEKSWIRSYLSVLVVLLLGRPPCQLKNYVGYSYIQHIAASKSKRKGAVTFRHEE